MPTTLEVVSFIEKYAVYTAYGICAIALAWRIYTFLPKICNELVKIRKLLEK